MVVFWVVWALAFLGMACFFVSSIRAYLKQEEVAPRQPLGSDDGLEDPRIVALEAQFFLAPSLALVEMREMLLDAGLPKSIAGEVEELSLARLLLEERSAEFGAGQRNASLQRQDPRA